MSKNFNKTCNLNDALNILKIIEKKIMNILCVICARGGSQGLKNKNVLNIKGKPLIHYTLDIAKKSKLYSKIVVSSDSNKILKISKEYKPDLLLKRPKFLATPSVSKIKKLLDMH